MVFLRPKQLNIQLSGGAEARLKGLHRQSSCVYPFREAPKLNSLSLKIKSVNEADGLIRDP